MLQTGASQGRTSSNAVSVFNTSQHGSRRPDHRTIPQTRTLTKKILYYKRNSACM